MALARELKRCSFCGEEIKFIPNKPTKLQKLLFFMGDLGGDYEKHTCPESEKVAAEIRKEAIKIAKNKHPLDRNVKDTFGRL